ncbi:predicted protein [Botrytis cinerea T4]|uniref:Uncharacterized protein n=1 Tax=Botryotinia fuckeliana (strain T4) TaxID=999810 RepID=G2YFJ1_BOTF4|nr:predicted protein [Botrytis cinerea T4]
MTLTNPINANNDSSKVPPLGSWIIQSSKCLKALLDQNCTSRNMKRPSPMARQVRSRRLAVPLTWIQLQGGER